MGLSLTAALGAGTQVAVAQTAAPPVTQVAVQPAPIHAIPEGPAEAPDGASALGDSVGPTASTLNAQLSALRTRTANTSTAQTAAAPAPTVAVARRVMDAAAAFDSYVHRASAIMPDVHDGADVAKAVLVAAAYEPGQFQEGAVAYAALAALQDAPFVQGVNELGQDPAVRRELVRRLLDKPETALQLPGARGAGALVVSVVGRLGDSVIATGAAVKQASYTMQQQGWSKGAIDGPDGLLATVKTQSATKIVLAPADAPALITNVVAAGKLGVAPQAKGLAPTATVAHGLALAALAVLGAAGDETADQLTPVLSDSTNAQCLKMAKLNLNQCLAVAGPHYEGMFCLGRHGLMETGQCVVTAVGWTPAPPPAPPSRSIMVPIALASLDGPERESVMGSAAAAPPPTPVPVSAPAPQAAEPTPVNYAVAPALPAPAPAVALPLPPPAPAVSRTYAMAAPAPGGSLIAPSPWRPNGPQPGDSFVGGPLGSPAPAVAPAALSYQDGGPGVAPPPAGGAYSYGPSTD
jgi:hypothetical protein